MKKNVEKLDELEEALKNAQEELIVCLIEISHLLFLYEFEFNHLLPLKSSRLVGFTYSSVCISSFKLP